MLKIDAQQVGISQGTIVLFSDYQDGGLMWTGSGPRELRRVVTFDEPYSAPPKVQVNLSMWDVDQQHNSRMDISADMVTPEGFVIVFRTWGDTKIARIRAGWMAIGAIRHEDDWDIY